MIATQLKLPEGEIEAIRRDECDVLHCLRKSILVWLCKIKPLSTRERLVEALMSPSVGRENLAEKILPNHAQSSCCHEAVKHFGMLHATICLFHFACSIYGASALWL